MTRIAHFSDLHGNLTPLFETEDLPDVWVCSGDVYPSISQGHVLTESIYQPLWLAVYVGRLVAIRLAGVLAWEVVWNNNVALT